MTVHTIGIDMARGAVKLAALFRDDEGTPSGWPSAASGSAVAT